MQTISIEAALERHLSRASKCARCGDQGHVVATPDGEVVVDGSPVHLDCAVALCPDASGEPVCASCAERHDDGQEVLPGDHGVLTVVVETVTEWGACHGCLDVDLGLAHRDTAQGHFACRPFSEAALRAARDGGNCVLEYLGDDGWEITFPRRYLAIEQEIQADAAEVRP